MSAKEEKIPTTQPLRGNPGNISITGDERRHKADLELIKAAGNHTSGPQYSDETMSEMKQTFNGKDNFHPYGTETSNKSDHEAAKKVIEAHQHGQFATLTHNQAAHIKEGVEFVKSHKDELPRGVVNAYSSIIGAAKDSSGHKVADRHGLM